MLSIYPTALLQEKRKQEKMIEVFKTNVADGNEVKHIISLLRIQLPAARINIDLHDCDRILRVEGEDLDAELIVNWVKSAGYECCVLE